MVEKDVFTILSLLVFQFIHVLTEESMAQGDGYRGCQCWHTAENWQKKSQQEANRTYCRGHRLSFFILTNFSERSCYFCCHKLGDFGFYLFTVIPFFMCRNRTAGEAVWILPQDVLKE